MTYLVYADVLLILNFACDFLLLYAAGSWLRLPPKLLRIAAAALLGAVYALGRLLPQLQLLYTLPAAVLTSLLMLHLAYPQLRRATFLRLTAAFYGASFALGGAALGFSTFLTQQGWDLGLPQLQLSALLFAVPVLLIVLRQGIREMRRSYRKSSYQLQLEVVHQGRSVRLPALLDTGNDLHEPFSALPVVVAEYAALEALLPQALREAWRQSSGDAASLLTHLPEGPWRQRLRLVPFASIGREHGLLPGFKPDALYLIDEQGRHQASAAILCLYPQKLHTDYAAVVNPEIMLPQEGRFCA